MILSRELMPIILLPIAAALGIAAEGPPGAGVPSSGTSELSRHRIVAKAHYENDDFEKAIAEFRRCVELAPDSAGDRINLALALTRAKKYDDAIAAFKEAEALDPTRLEIYYDLGIIYKRRNEHERAAAYLEKVVAKDPETVGAYYNLGTVYKMLKEDAKAEAAFREVVRLNPNHSSAHYQLITLARKAGRKEDADRETEIYNRLKDLVDPAERTIEALERSRYSNLVGFPTVGGPEPGKGADVRYVDVTERAGLRGQPRVRGRSPAERPIRAGEFSPEYARESLIPSEGGAVAFSDYDGDGDLDLYLVGCDPDPELSANRLMRNRGDGTFEDVTGTAGVGDTGLGTDAAFGDLTGDGRPDLYVVNAGPNVLYRNEGDGTFCAIVRAGGADEPQFGKRVALIDHDRDNDLDILLGNLCELRPPAGKETFSFPADFPGALNTLLRNRGGGIFEDLTDEAGFLVEEARAVDLVVADFDGMNAIDVLVVNEGTPSRLFLDQGGRLAVQDRLADGPAPPGYAGAAADIDNDGDPDIVLATGEGLEVYLNDGAARFRRTRAPLGQGIGEGRLGPLCIFDHDNDGWVDIIAGAANGSRLVMLANLGPDGFKDVSGTTGLDRPWPGIARLAAGDYDGDGDVDLAALSREGPILLANEGASRASWIEVLAAGVKVNRSAYGAKIEARTGSLVQMRTVRDGPVHFGLGPNAQPDVVRVTWPNGVVQNVVAPEPKRVIEIKEKIRVSASCAFLWTCGGGRFHFINEILGIGPLGVPTDRGTLHVPDCDELTWIEGERLEEVDGRYRLRLTEELREICYADRITLRVVDHPAETTVIPNEYFTAPPFPEDKLHAFRDLRPLAAAVDGRGRDIAPLLRARDDRFPPFERTHDYDGLAETHGMILDLGPFPSGEPVILFLEGWIYWPESSVVVAISQDPRVSIRPPGLEVRDEKGRWVRAIESIGLPTSKGMTVPVDLTGRFPTEDHRVRIITNLCLYWDRAFVAAGPPTKVYRVTELDPLEAELRYRGFSAMSRDDRGYERFDYERVRRFGPWNQPRGFYTRYGPVAELLADADDKYVIFGPGDELALEFEAGGLPVLPPGWRRDFVFYANGWVKDGDPNTVRSGTVEPLPFHGMSGYPPEEPYPEDPDHDAYRKSYNTRRETCSVGPLRGR